MVHDETNKSESDTSAVEIPFEALIYRVCGKVSPRNLEPTVYYASTLELTFRATGF